MDKIVIVTSQPKPNNSLLAWLYTLFPDCEIQIVFRGLEPQKRVQSPQLAAVLASESKNGKLPYGRRFPAAYCRESSNL